MAVRSGNKQRTLQEAVSRIYKDISRAYGFWFLGLIIGAVGLKPNSVSTFGLSLSIERPDAIQGLVFLTSIAFSINALIAFQNSVNPYLKPSGLRVSIWAALPRGTRSLRGKTRKDINELRTKVVRLIKLGTGIAITAACLPILLILLFHGRSLFRGMASIFGLL